MFSKAACLVSGEPHPSYCPRTRTRRGVAARPRPGIRVRTGKRRPCGHPLAAARPRASGPRPAKMPGSLAAPESKPAAGPSFFFFFFLLFFLWEWGQVSFPSYTSTASIAFLVPTREISTCAQCIPCQPFPMLLPPALNLFHHLPLPLAGGARRSSPATRPHRRPLSRGPQSTQRQCRPPRRPPRAAPTFTLCVRARRAVSSRLKPRHEIDGTLLPPAPQAIFQRRFRRR